MNEASLQTFVIETAQTFGWMVMHTRTVQLKDGRWMTPLQGDAGFPDLVLARSGEVLIVELKVDGKYPDPAQKKWLEATGGAVWRPSDMEMIEDRLSGGRIIR